MARITGVAPHDQFPIDATNLHFSYPILSRCTIGLDGAT